MGASPSASLSRVSFLQCFPSFIRIPKLEKVIEFSILLSIVVFFSVWLAGPTTMVVGLVLCGKVVIDWGPAMLHAREGSIDSALVEQIANPVLNSHEGDASLSHALTKNQLDPRHTRPIPNGECPRHPRVHHYDGDVGQEGAIDCIIYSQYDSASNSNVSFFG